MSLEKVLKKCSHTEFLDIYTRLETTIHTNIVGIPYVTHVSEDWHCCHIPVTSFLYTKERLPKYILQRIRALFLLWLITHFLNKYQWREVTVRALRLLTYLRWSCEPITIVENTVLKETKSEYHIFPCKIAAALLLPLIMLLSINEVDGMICAQ